MNTGGTIRRLAGGVSGQASVRVTMVLQTVVLVPVLIAAWGLNIYGAWLAITALGSFVGLTNFGLSNASGNAMILAIGADDDARARRIFNTTLTVLAVLSVPLIGAIALASFLAPLDRWLNLEAVSAFDVSLVLVFVAIQVWLNTFKGVFAAAISAIGRYGLPSFITAATKVLEVGGISLVVLLWDGSVLAAASVLVAGAALDLVVQFFAARRLVTWAQFRPRETDLGLIKELVKPSLGNVILQVGVNAVVVQGPRVLLSIVMGPAAVAIFAVHATAIRLADQVTSLFVGPLQLEIARAVGGGRMSRAATFIAIGTQAAVAAFLLTVLVLVIIGPVFFEHWTVGRIEFDYGLFVLLAVAVAATNIGKMSVAAIIGINRIFGPALAMLPVTVAAIFVGAVFASWFGVNGMAIGWLAAEVGIAAIALLAAARVLTMPLATFLLHLSNVHETRRQVWQVLTGHKPQSET